MYMLVRRPYWYVYLRVFSCRHQLLRRQRARCEWEEISCFLPARDLSVGTEVPACILCCPAVGADCCLPLNVCFFAALLVTVVASVAYFVVCALFHHTSVFFFFKGLS